MILRADEPDGGRGAPATPAPEARGAAPPWTRGELLDGLATCVFWTTGPDPETDGLFRIQARRAADGARLDRHARPFEGSDAGSGEVGGGATARMQREFGVTAAELEDAPAAAAYADELARFLGSGPVLVLDREPFEAYWLALQGPEGPPAPSSIALGELAALLFPGRHRGAGEGLAPELLRPVPPRPRAWTPQALEAALGTLIGRFLQLGFPAAALLAHGHGSCIGAWSEEEGEASRALLHALCLVEHCDRLGGGESSLYPPHPSLHPGVLGLAADRHPSLARAFRALETPWSRERREGMEHAPVPVDAEDPLALDPEDGKRLDEVFEHHLPEHFGTQRKGQHEVARAIGESLGTGELLLVHAPTGTGKTLAYLVPWILYAARHELRLGIATYTRALQEQAMAQEVPLALELCRRAGLAKPPRVAVLKGRANYLCWRSLEMTQPDAREGPAERFAFTALALFGAADADGDLDRFPGTAPLPLGDPRPTARAIAARLALVRATTGCCTVREDRDSCAAEVARRRAERAHVVLTNHAFALSQQTFFKHLVFDECEHLHTQAHSAWSHVVPFVSIQALLEDLDEPGAPKRSVLSRLKRGALPGTELHQNLLSVGDAHASALEATAALAAAAEDFEAWREARLRERDERDRHSLFREYVLETDEGQAILEAQLALVAAGDLLASDLAELSERFDRLAVRGKRRLRRTLDRFRAQLDEVLAAVTSWIPRREGRPAFARHTFYDVERDSRGRAQLAARVLLPHEYLGRHYYPQLAGAVLISATTWLEKGFDTAAAYLGLERAAHPAPEEEREPAKLATFRSPDPFDYSRVLVGVPRDAPAYTSSGKERFLDWAGAFVRRLALFTRGRILVLFTNALDCRRLGEDCASFFRGHEIPFWYQGMASVRKEELAARFRSRVDSVLFGLDTFWYGADFPGETLEYLVILKLPYGVPDRYHHAQCAALGEREQRRTIYRPRALAKFRQGFGRLMRREKDRGCVFVLDQRILEPRHRGFLQELPLQTVWPQRGNEDGGRARLVRGDAERCLREGLAHMGMLADAKRRGFEEGELWSEGEPPGDSIVRASEGAEPAGERRVELDAPGPTPRDPEEWIDVREEDLPY